MAHEEFAEDIAQARAAYFRAADTALEKIRQQYGDGREGLMRFLNINDVENFSKKKPDND